MASHRALRGGSLSHSLVDCPETTELLRVLREARRLRRFDLVNLAETALAAYCTTPDEGTAR